MCDASYGNEADETDDLVWSMKEMIEFSTKERVGNGLGASLTSRVPLIQVAKITILALENGSTNVFPPPKRLDCTLGAPLPISHDGRKCSTILMMFGRVRPKYK